MIYSFDGSYDGLLTSVFTAFERKQFTLQLLTTDDFQETLFEKPLTIHSDRQKADRVLSGLQKKLPKNAVADFWKAYLSEDPKIYSIILKIMIHVFKGNTDILSNYGDEDVLYFHQTLKKVSRERHRVKAFVRFQKSEDGMYTAIMEPDFNVLPLVADFFRKRYADQRWLIYDNKRKYGLYYDLQQVTEVELTATENSALQNLQTQIHLDSNDSRYARMWKGYFDSTNIAARKNMKLHLQHVPRRYWKYLPEKQNTG
ncbi:TIGR03915 family putative DNA repair protein [Sphingobacterium sp. Mn56C]|uniref:TIGR03915 family putative DNA repair protein n=1 Tax=Sphingobacterium sp. Mn56C TaxID=3395261 RepID=UPI003BD9D4F8